MTVAALVAVATGCGNGDRVPRQAASAATVTAPPVYVRTAAGLAGVDAEAGTVRFELPGAAAAPGWSTLVQSGVDSTGLWLSALDSRTGDVRWTGRADPALAVRVVSTDGSRLALAPRQPARTGGAGASYPAGRATTPIAVVGPSPRDARRFDLPGNFEPEAFSLDGAALFVIEYSPALAPDRYRVRSLDLATGAIGDVASPDKELQQDMRGAPSTQVPAPDGSRVYTLYSRVDDDGRVRAFVHVLDLAGRWAHCVDLPDLFARPGTALAVAPDGRRLVAVTRDGDVAEIDAGALGVVRTGALATTVSGPAALADDGRVYVIDTADRVLVAAGVGEPTTVLAAAPAGAFDLALTRDGRRLLAAAHDTVRVVDAASGALVRDLALTNVTSLSWPSPLLDAGSGAIECAC